MRLQGIHQPQEPGPCLELGPADAVVDEDGGLIDRPALRRGVGAGMFDLTGDRLLVIGHA
jgi:hypothetical protein